jgi:hypothetical protein
MMAAGALEGMRILGPAPRLGEHNALQRDDIM